MKMEFVEKDLNAIRVNFELVFIRAENQRQLNNCRDFFKLMNYKGEGVCLDSTNRRIFVELKSLNYEDARLAFFTTIKSLEKPNIKNIKSQSVVGSCVVRSFACMTEGVGFINYEFSRYKSERKSSALKHILLSKEELNAKKFNKKGTLIGLQREEVLAKACHSTKNIINEIPRFYTPLKMAGDAQDLVEEHKAITCKIYDEKFLKKERMNAFLAANRASVYPPRLIHLSYKNQKAKQKIVFVGRGLTYGSGGLSLKPADYMLTMKTDKSGAATAVGIIKAVAELNLELEVHCILGTTGNMIGGNAYKPDDALLSREGVSIGVRNTDAKERLVLADCLSFTQDLKPSLLIDLATLTGACMVGLGEFTSGIMGSNENLQNEFYEVSQKSGEYACVLHFNPHSRELIKSKITDTNNTSSSRYGGALTAGIFLDSSIREGYKDKWLHLDTAGPTYLEKAWGYRGYGASAAGVRMCVNFLIHLLRKAE